MDAARVLTFACPDDDWAFTHTMALDPVCLGRWPEPDICGPRLAASIAAVPQYINDALPLGKPDMVGLNIYNAAPAQMGENGPSYVERPAGYAHTAMNWPVEPECLNWGPRQIQERYGLPMFITENGLSCTDKVYRDGKVHECRPHRFSGTVSGKAVGGHPCRCRCAGIFPVESAGQLRVAQRLPGAVRSGVCGLRHRAAHPERQRILVR